MSERPWTPEQKRAINENQPTFLLRPVLVLAKQPFWLNGLFLI